MTTTWSPDNSCAGRRGSAVDADMARRDPCIFSTGASSLRLVSHGPLHRRTRGPIHRKSWAPRQSDKFMYPDYRCSAGMPNSSNVRSLSARSPITRWEQNVATGDPGGHQHDDQHASVPRPDGPTLSVIVP